MSVVYRTSLKNTRLSAVVTDIGATGKLIIGTAGLSSTLATLDLSSTAGTVGSELKLRPGESLLVRVVGTAVTSNPALGNNWQASVILEEDEETTFAISGTVTLSGSPVEGARVGRHGSGKPGGFLARPDHRGGSALGIARD